MRFSFLLVIFGFLLCGLPHTAYAHELRPAYLSIQENVEGQYDILWKTPTRGEEQLNLEVLLPEKCIISSKRRTPPTRKFTIETWKLDCTLSPQPTSLRGERLHIEGLEKTLTDVLVRVSWIDGETTTTRLTPDKTSYIFSSSQNIIHTVKTYFSLGFEHILGGIDHLLFILAVLLLVTRKNILWTLTAFTLGHSITLALASLDIVRLNPNLVELLIAMSIVLMSYEAVRRHRGYTGLTFDHPWVVTFCFGLLHGFGFAGALRDIGLPQNDLAAALLFFNIGVEAGQILCVVIVGLLTLLPFLKMIFKHKTGLIFTSYLIGIIAIFWTFQRGTLFLFS
ncbi:MAG: hypothetical protein COA43_15625 [Robiginitomaculum sp.]|nr:MAG: hypothetical protein COA43_15625 [Robiginitomaculum sp.]